MAKKPSAKSVKKPARAAKAKVPARAKRPRVSARRAAAEKYQQAGAPWWKSHLPE